MEPLDFSRSKELFSSGVFSCGEEDHHQLDEASDEIVRRCAGLPLAIITIASALASQEEADTAEKLDQTRERWKWLYHFVYSVIALFLQACHLIKPIQPHKNSTTGGCVQNFLLKNLPTNTTYSEKMKQVLNLCYNSLPICLQTCLLYLSLYPENYIILKEDIMKQWVAEGFIHTPTEKDSMKVAGSYFDRLVSMGLIQLVDVDYSDEVLYYVVHHMVHDLITSKSIDENFITVMDYSLRTIRFSNKVNRLSLQFGSTTHATSPESTTTGLSQVRSLAFFGLMSCQPSIFGFKILRSLILHLWADQPRTGVDLRRISELLLLTYLQVTCNDTVHLPDQLQGLKHLETLEINARVAAIPSDIFHLLSLLHLRLGTGTELPDVTGVLKNFTLNPPILLDELSSRPNSVKTIQLFQPVCRIPRWIGQLTNLCILKFVVRELQSDDINNLHRLPLTFLSLHVQRRTTGLISFAAGAFTALEYFEFRCGVLRLMFQEGTMPNLLRLKLCFNAHTGQQYGGFLVGIEDMLSIPKISVLIGSAAGAGEREMEAAESAVKKALGQHHSNVSVRRADTVEEELDTPDLIRGKHPAISSEQPVSIKQQSHEDIKQNINNNYESIKRRSNSKEDASNVKFPLLEEITDGSQKGKLGSGGFGKPYMEIRQIVQENRQILQESSPVHETIRATNLFGEVVDNYKLDQMESYRGKLKRWDDRAREALILVKEDDKDDRALRYADGLKSLSGYGQSTLCLVYNATGGTLRKVDNHDWSGQIGLVSYPALIGNGQWAVFHHVNQEGTQSDSVAAVVYRGRDEDGVYRGLREDGEELDYLLAWRTPWSSWSRNKAYCDIGRVGYFKRRWADVHEKLIKSDYSSEAMCGEGYIKAEIGRGNSPKFTAKLTSLDGHLASIG